MKFFRYLAVICLLAFAAGYLDSAWSIYRSDREFLSRERAVAVATVTGLRDMSGAERGLSLPLNEDALQVAEVSYRHQGLGVAGGSMRIPPAIAARAREGLPIAVEYTLDATQPARFVGVTRAPVWRLCTGVALLVLAACLARWRS